MVLPNRPSNNTPIPNNPFYSPLSEYLNAGTGPLVVGNGLEVDYATGSIKVLSSATPVTGLLEGQGINIVNTGSGVFEISATGVQGLLAGYGIIISPLSLGQYQISTTAAQGTVTSITAGAGLTGGTITHSGTIALSSVDPPVIGSYTYPCAITVDTYGRVTSVSSGFQPLPLSLLNTKGQLIIGVGPSQAIALPVGSNGEVLSADSSSPAGVKWTRISETAVTCITGTAPICVSGPQYTPIISVLPATLTTCGAVRLSNSTNSGSIEEALTAAAGCCLQQQINALAPYSGTVSSVSVTTPLSITGNPTVNPTISVACATTADRGVVQLNDTTTSSSTLQALTANQGRNLQNQINSLAQTTGALLAGTINGSTGLIISVTPRGTASNFVPGSPLPVAAAGNSSYYVIVEVPGTMTPPGGVSTFTNIGDWWLSDGTSWIFLNVGASPPSASTTVPGIVELATNAETQNGTDSSRAIVPSALQSKVSNCCNLASSTTIASSQAVKSVYDIAITGGPYATQFSAGTVCFATASETFNGLVSDKAVTPATLQGKVSDSTTLPNSSYIASSLALATVNALAAGAVQNCLVTNSGQILVSCQSGCVRNFPNAPRNGCVLTSCSSNPYGICWATPTGGGGGGGVSSITAGAGLAGGTITSSGTIDVCFATSSDAINGLLLDKSLTPGALQSKVSDCTTLSSSNYIASSLALANVNSIAIDAVPNCLVTNCGQILVGCQSGCVKNFPNAPGNGCILTSCSSNPYGICWAPPATGSCGVTSITAGTGLSGGTITSTGTIALETTGVSSGTYNFGPQQFNVSVNPQGQITSVLCTASLYARTCDGAIGSSFATHVGFEAGEGSPGVGNSTLGYRAGRSVTGCCNTYLGMSAGEGRSASFSTAIGLCSGVSGSQNVSVGTEAGNFSCGECSIYIGLCAGRCMTNLNTNLNNIFLGYSAGVFTSGRNNIAIGKNAFDFSLEPACSSNVAESIAIGTSSGRGSGTAAIAIGFCAGCNIGMDVIAIGSGAGYNPLGCCSYGSVGIGSDANRCSCGAGTVAVGAVAGSGTFGSCNVSVGTLAGAGSTGGDNVAVGASSGYFITGCANVNLGKNAGRTGCGNHNVHIGNLAGNCTSGTINENVFIGCSAGCGANCINNIAIGSLAGAAASCESISIGRCAGCNAGSNSINIGTKSGDNPADRTNPGVINIGYCAGMFISGEWHTTVGAFAFGNGAGFANTSIGYNAGSDVVGCENVALGSSALGYVNGSQNVGLGACTGLASNGDCNVFVGHRAGFCPISASNRNIYMGFEAGLCTSGVCNTVIGSGAYRVEPGRVIPASCGVVAIGDSAGLGGGTNSVAIGFCAGAGSGPGWVSIGARAGEGATSSTACNSVHIGCLAGYNMIGPCNTSIGQFSHFQACGCQNTSIGTCAGCQIDGGCNVAVGSIAGSFRLGDLNISIGHCTGHTRIGYRNVLIGTLAGVNYAPTPELASYNVYIGDCAGRGAAGSNNIAIGCNAFGACTTGGTTFTPSGESSILIGARAGQASAVSNVIYLGNDIRQGCNSVVGTNAVVIGSPGMTYYYWGSTTGGWNTPSDARLKTCVCESALGLSFLNKIQPREFTWCYETENPANGVRSVGIIAQEVLEAVCSTSCSELLGVVSEAGGGYWSNSNGFIWPLINAVKELSAENTQLKKRLDNLEDRLTALGS